MLWGLSAAPQDSLCAAWDSQGHRSLVGTVGPTDSSQGIKNVGNCPLASRGTDLNVHTESRGGVMPDKRQDRRADPRELEQVFRNHATQEGSSISGCS